MKQPKKPVAQNYVYKDNPDKKFTKKCKYCRQVIDKKASICPYCLRRQPIGCLGWIIITIVLAISMGTVIYFGISR
jgi:hypothetical protein